MTREEAIKYLIKVRDNCDYDRCPDFNPYEDRILYGRCTCDICEEAVDIAIETLAKESKCGKWIDIEGQLGMQCSECGKMCNEITLCTDMMTKAHWNYCPNCGTKMEE